MQNRMFSPYGFCLKFRLVWEKNGKTYVMVPYDSHYMDKIEPISWENYGKTNVSVDKNSTQFPYHGKNIGIPICFPVNGFFQIVN